MLAAQKRCQSTIRVILPPDASVASREICALSGLAAGTWCRRGGAQWTAVEGEERPCDWHVRTASASPSPGPSTQWAREGAWHLSSKVPGTFLRTVTATGLPHNDSRSKTTVTGLRITSRRQDPPTSSTRRSGAGSRRSPSASFPRRPGRSNGSSTASRWAQSPTGRSTAADARHPPHHRPRRPRQLRRSRNRRPLNRPHTSRSHRSPPPDPNSSERGLRSAA